jgi:hypothetical protein
MPAHQSLDFNHLWDHYIIFEPLNSIRIHKLRMLNTFYADERRKGKKKLQDEVRNFIMILQKSTLNKDR